MYKKIFLKDKVVQNAINKEFKRQKEHIELIASENYVSQQVLKAQGSVLTNKYGEGYPGKRYYGGCENVDVVEQVAIDRLKAIFNVKYANVQPYSGSVANAAALAALMPNDRRGRLLGMSLQSGGHLTHGYKISFSGIFYDSFTYDVNEEGVIDYDKVLEIAKEVKPDVIICGYSAYSRTIDFKKFREIADEVGAKLMADIAHIAGLIAGKVHPSPVEYAHLITSTTHKTLRGGRGAIIMTNDETLAAKINRWVFPGYQGGPLFHAIAGKAVAFEEALQPFFEEYAQNIVDNAKAFSETFKLLGAKVVSNGTDNHLFILNVLETYNKNGKECEELLSQINITANKNTIPFDTQSPFISSGIRLGTAAMTSRGFGQKEFIYLANIMDSYLKDPSEENKIKSLKAIKKLTKKFPIKKSYY
ncbi:serine hydroxymethyltransferase [Mycoplasma phocimorsus]|uniref:serine hydroxymethyltransferase n=1 Tax=Mycoplasma phocimorsus TaxID=3045839 RepID=UPI0024BFE28B|nr:serine hydroxymethyltransferase [Mycoplasma phocimorsus]MDJ1646315.1 serine hydroxymethyltransferase [Mycoplasma phocimorsus]MDJ1647886.1 serine hydroxymethyltransferase [Mycoplasma phocimorsus]MDJ1648406.1 serine hydroxymethyltransferase [Mycoplasma phocimorsus]MDJ1649036.1 serine hydroxymethyltransferase [Mycoplasma phocimorsus]